MKKALGLLGLAAAALVFFGPAWGYVETFSSHNAGWLAVTIDNYGCIQNSQAQWNQTGGNPGGFVSGYLSASGPRLYGIQAPFGPTPFRDLTGMALTVDFKLEGQVTGPQTPKVRFYIGFFNGESRYWVSKDEFSWNPNQDTQWTTHMVALLESNFILWPNQNYGDMTFEEVLRNYNDIGLVFADGFTNIQTLGFSGTGRICVDNFGAVVPIPGAVWLLGSGLLGLAASRGLKRPRAKAPKKEVR